MLRIAFLPSNIANQIAAVEVVERPASVVKELIENSIDAKAKHIHIDIGKGGLQLIRVKDDGIGIHPEDLALALARHATSKIKTEKDLFQIQSLGFRGEALASLASVARVQLASKQKDQQYAYQINCEQGQLSEIKPVAHPEGTTVEVCDLFFNVPARRKFLKSENTEFSHIQDVVERMVLYHIDKGFVLTHQQRVVYEFPIAETEKEKQARIAKICGQDFVDNAINLDVSASGLSLQGYVGLPVIARACRDLQYFYVNQRPIKDRLVHAAIRRAYQDVLYSERFPAFILFLCLNPESVDVNAHPPKQEVRFRDSRLIYDFISSQIKKALQAVRPTATHHQVMLEVEESVSVSAVSSPKQSLATMPWHVRESIQQYSVLHDDAGDEEKPIMLTQAHQQEEVLPVLVSTPSTMPSLGYALGQLHQTYILAENAQGLVIVDMHAAHERVLYERLKKSLENQDIPSQTLLLPITLNVTEKEIQCVQAHQKFLLSMALDIAAAGPGVLIVRAVPAQLIETNITQLVRDMLSDLSEHEKSYQVEDKTREFLGNFACRAAVHANHKLTILQMNALLREVEKTDLSGQCNHGRPTFRQFSMSELDKFFLRGR